MGVMKEEFVSDDRPGPTAFDDFIVRFIVAFSGTTLLVLSSFL
jgi:hypothetical protein